MRQLEGGVATPTPAPAPAPAAPAPAPDSVDAAARLREHVRGDAAVGGSVFLERRTPSAANALAAGGVVVLYAAFWASHVLYHLVPMEVAFVLMALVTAVTVLLADRRRSPLTAVLFARRFSRLKRG